MPQFRHPARAAASPALAAILVALALAAGAACGGSSDSTSPTPDPKPRVVVSTYVDPRRADPGTTVRVTVRMELTGGASAEFLKLEASGLVTYADSVAVEGPGPHELVRDLALPEYPSIGSVTLRGSARAAAGRHHITADSAIALAVGDADAPVIATFSVAQPQSAQAGDTVQVTYAVTAPTPLRTVQLRTSGAFETEFAIPMVGVGSQSGTFRFRVPAAAEPGGPPLVLHLDAYNQDFHRAGRTLPPIPVIDTTAPSVSALYVGPGALFAGVDSAELAISAADNHRLSWVGWRVGAPFNRQDSVAVADSARPAATSWIPIDGAWSGAGAISVFARDAGGRLTEAPVRTVTVYPRVTRANRFVTLAPGAGVRDYVYDAKRDVLYLLQYGVLRVEVLSLSTMTFGAPIPLPGLPFGLDISAGGDSLLVVLNGVAALGVVDLAAAARPVTLVPLGFVPSDVRSVSNGKAFLVTADAGVGPIVELALATGATRTRADANTNFALTAITRPTDRSRVAFFWRRGNGVAQAGCVRWYDAASDAFTPCGLVDPPYGDVTEDAARTRLLVFNQLLDNRMTPIRTFAPPLAFYGSSALSRDGSRAYFISGDGVLKAAGFTTLRTADGAVLEWTPLPLMPRLISLLPDGHRLVAIGPTCVPAGCSLSERVVVADLP